MKLFQPIRERKDRSLADLSAQQNLEIKVIGTANVKKLDILRDSQVIASFEPGRREHEMTWTDPKPLDGTHYYYVRVQQADDQLAWGSPMWITAGN